MFFVGSRMQTPTVRCGSSSTDRAAAPVANDDEVDFASTPEKRRRVWPPGSSADSKYSVCEFVGVWPMSFFLYAGLAIVVLGLIWVAARFIREARSIRRYVRRTKATGHVKSEIRRHRRTIAKRARKLEPEDSDRA